MKTSFVTTVLHKAGHTKGSSYMRKEGKRKKLRR
jgi:hypothetical protein